MSSTVLISAHKFRKILYGPASGKLGIKVDADRAIDIHTVTASDLERWKTGKRFAASSFKRRSDLNILFTSGPEFEDDWYLILENYSDDPVSVEYEVFERR